MKTRLAASFSAALSSDLTIASNSSLQVPAATDFSICGWFYPTAAGSYRGLAGKASTGTAAQDSYGLQIAHPATADLWEFFVVNNAAYHATDSDNVAPVTLNQWAFVCGTYNHATGTGTLTVNTTVYTANLNAASVHQGTASFDVGGRGAAGFLFDGLIDNVGFSQQLLSPADVTTLFNNGNGLAASELPAALAAKFVSYWDFDNRTFNDRIGANNLTALGTVGFGPGR